ncbi:MAG: 50S ribosomal protein L17 [Candidatus Omnitrophica bacterium]|nr:50S ribosomal protein L17 [Candidatus Omnitrophota bacterium]
MRHRKNTIRFGRQKSHYKQTLRQLVSGLIISKSISTTKVKAKEASRLMDKLVTVGRKDSLASRRKAYSVLRDKTLVSILFNEIAPLFKNRNGGYTRVMLTGKRRGDKAQMAILEFVEKPKIEPVPKKEEKKKAKEKDKPPQLEPKEKKQIPEEAKVKKEEIVKEEIKEQPKKEVPHPRKEPRKPQKPIQKPGFFKKFFGRKKDQ